jgi:hypothetical protein
MPFAFELDDPIQHMAIAVDRKAVATKVAFAKNACSGRGIGV